MLKEGDSCSWEHNAIPRSSVSSRRPASLASAYAITRPQSMHQLSLATERLMQHQSPGSQSLALGARDVSGVSHPHTHKREGMQQSDFGRRESRGFASNKARAHARCSSDSIVARESRLCLETLASERQARACIPVQPSQTTAAAAAAASHAVSVITSLSLCSSIAAQDCQRVQSGCRDDEHHYKRRHTIDQSIS